VKVDPFRATALISNENAGRLGATGLSRHNARRRVGPQHSRDLGLRAEVEVTEVRNPFGC
jgi:hypothetical protein